MGKSAKTVSGIFCRLCVLVVLLAPMIVYWPAQANIEWNCSPADGGLWPTFDPDKHTHQWIVDKAIAYLRTKGLLSNWPLEEYKYYIKRGTFFADLPYPMLMVDPEAVQAWLGPTSPPWEMIEEVAPTGNTHYLNDGPISLSNHPIWIGEIPVATTGGATAKEQAEVLYALASDFWPGGRPVPDIHDLPLKAGPTIGFVFQMPGYAFGPNVIGAHPFAYDLCCWNGVTDVSAANNKVIPLLGTIKCGDWNPTLAYQWPKFVSKSPSGAPLEDEESLRHASLTYLGWAIHMLQDLTMPGHARNRTGGDHRNFENVENDFVNSGVFDNEYPVPVDPNGQYAGMATIGVTLDLFVPELTLNTFSSICYSKAIDVWESTDNNRKHQGEVLFDTAIKVVAGVIYKFAVETGDIDGDGVLDTADNCINVGNPDQVDFDNDGIGDACDPDDDNDGIGDAHDNCPLKANPDQNDFDNDGIGDACDPDDDNDGVGDAYDNCPLKANPGQADFDNDGIGDACDPDDDNDGVGDVFDNCPLKANPDQSDIDQDGKGDVCDDDMDGDGVKNSADNCPMTANSDQNDFDGDGLGDVCDADIDGDGILNELDQCELTPRGKVVDSSTGCSIEQSVPCHGPRGATRTWKNHGEYIETLAQTLNTFRKKGLLTEEEMELIMDAAASSDCGKK